MRLIYSVILIFLASGLFAAPLESGYSLAPRSSASAEEKNQAYMNARNRVIEAAKKYEGVPYRFGGMTASGLDCSGFIVLSFRDALGVTPPRSASGLFTWSVRISPDKIQPGDLVFFRTDSSRNITHVGLYVGNRRFIHSASAGTKTGVIFSSLDEQYYARTFAGAGRVFPEAPSGFNSDNNSFFANDNSARPVNSVERSVNRPPGRPPVGEDSMYGKMFAGVGIAPIWNGFIQGGELVRGFSAQFCVYVDTNSFGSRMVFGFELRPEYDGASEIFRLPITLSFGPSEKLRVFVGPVYSFGNATVYTDNGKRSYSGGLAWFGTIGGTAAPFVFDSHVGDFSPFVELAWQSYESKNNNFDFIADFSAGFRFSTGIRWLMRVK
jgi:probable lipoprotein NlpC